MLASPPCSENTFMSSKYAASPLIRSSTFLTLVPLYLPVKDVFSVSTLWSAGLLFTNQNQDTYKIFYLFLYYKYWNTGSWRNSKHRRPSTGCNSDKCYPEIYRRWIAGRRRPASIAVLPRSGRWWRNIVYFQHYQYLHTYIIQRYQYLHIFNILYQYLYIIFNIVNTCIFSTLQPIFVYFH